MGLPYDVSWTIRKIFQFRDVSQPLIQYKIGNGASTHLWLDNWHPLGRLYKRYGENVCSNIGRSSCARVPSIISDGAWSWPRQRNRIQEIKANTSSDFLPDISNEDSVVWIPSRNGIYSLKSAWEAIRVSHGAQEWCHIVWFSNLSLDGHLFYGWPCNAYLLLRRGC